MPQSHLLQIYKNTIKNSLSDWKRLAFLSLGHNGHQLLQNPQHHELETIAIGSDENRSKSVTTSAVIALGGNALGLGNQYTIAAQKEAMQLAAKALADILQQDLRLIITHGNGPQVGFSYERSLIAHLQDQEIPYHPLDICGADTQGTIGYILQQSLLAELASRGKQRSIVTVVTQVVVKRKSEDLDNPSKPIGKWMTEEEAREWEVNHEWAICHEDPNEERGWRRVVASPDPLEIVELDVVKALMNSGVIVITCGGGGIPVERGSFGELKGVESVIDKDRASALLATLLSADRLIIATNVPGAALNFNDKEKRIYLDEVTLTQAQHYLEEGQFGRGNMRPKIEAIIYYLTKGGKEAHICQLQNLSEALIGQSGTRFIL